MPSGNLAVCRGIHDPFEDALYSIDYWFILKLYKHDMLFSNKLLNY